jgi:DNA processing protein
MEQGRDVFAVPGSIFSQKSKGTHRLIRTGAALVTSAADILAEMHLETVDVQQELAAALPTNPDDPAEAALMAHLSAEPQHIDAITRACGLPASDVSALLTLLELKGFIRHVGNMEYVRAR